MLPVVLLEMIELTGVCESNDNVDCPSKPVHTASIIRKLAICPKSISLAQFLRMFLATPRLHNNQFITLKNLFIANIHRKICCSSSFPVISPHFKTQESLTSSYQASQTQKMCPIQGFQTTSSPRIFQNVFTWYARKVQMYFTHILFMLHFILTIKSLYPGYFMHFKHSSLKWDLKS